jgi:phosphoglycerate dehydrogenase-like enzyme
LNLGRGLFRVRDNQSKHLWADTNSRSLNNQHVAVLGAGAIGGEIACLYRNCGAEVTSYGRTGSATVAKISEFHRKADQFDILIACLPNTPATYELIDAELLGMCRLQQFINVGRGNTVNTDALLAALASGRIQQVVLDVFSTEPLPEESPLWDTHGFYVSPHRSAPTECKDIVDSLTDLLADSPASHLVVDHARAY